MFGNCFCFLVFKEKKKFCFQNEKHVWLVVLKNTFFKNKIQEICLIVVFEKVEFRFSLVTLKKKKLYLF